MLVTATKHLEQELSEPNKTMQQILRLLQLSLFEKRDLIALLRGDPPNLNHASNIEMPLL